MVNTMSKPQPRLATDIKAAPPIEEAAPRVRFHAGWFATATTPPKVDMVLPLAVLALAVELSDAQRMTTISQLYARCPRRAVDEAVTRLKYAAWITTDGVRVKILKTPAED